MPVATVAALRLAAVGAFALLLWSPAAFAQFAAGDCVLANGTPAVILGPSNIEGQYMARDSRLNQGAGQSFRADQLQSVPCPGEAAAKNVCFESDEGQGASDLEQTVRHALRTSLERSETQTYVSVGEVQVGNPREWTGGEETQFGIGDMSKAIVDVRATYRTCVDQVTDIYLTQQENNFVCFVAAANGEVVCEITGSTGDLQPPTSQSLPKY
ncbi:MAG TPA: hypothetical protein VG894_08455 [Bauldia sp.]|nr:hypothetical protein [Bauldia sp.]